jgi:hypothetical protein
MVNRLFLVMLLLATGTAHAQVSGSGGAPQPAAKATPYRAAVLLPRRLDAPPPSKEKAPRWLIMPRSAPPRIGPRPVKPDLQATKKER